MEHPVIVRARTTLGGYNNLEIYAVHLQIIGGAAAEAPPGATFCLECL